MTWQQFLTETVLCECWHGRKEIWAMDICPRCGRLPSTNHTFTTRNDLMDLYQKVYEDGKWEDFFWDFAFQRKPENYGLGEAETSVWLFCLDGKDYEARCKMVAEFYGWKGEK